MDNLVQFAEDFNSRTEKLRVVLVGREWLFQTRPITRSPDGDNNLVQLEENFDSRKTSSENSRKTSENS